MPFALPRPAGPLPRLEFIALIAALMALNALAIDVMLPALPDMGAALGVSSENDRQLVLSVYMFGMGLSQIVYGPLSDRFGRRSPLLIGMVIYLAMAFLAPFAPNYALLLALRFVQGIGAAGTRVIAQSIVRDSFHGRAMAEVFSLVFMVFMLIPIIAPGIGQVLLMLGHWSYIFVFMGGLATLITLWIFYRLPETLGEENRRPLSVDVIVGGFRLVFSNRMAMLYALAGVFLFGALFGFINAAQQVYVDIYGLGVNFPFAFGAMGVVMAISSYLNSRMVGRIGMRRLSHYALLVYTGFAVLWWLVSLAGTPPLWLFLLFLGIVMFHFGWTASNMNSLSMEPLGKVAGTAAAVFGFLQTVGGAALGLTIGRMFDGTITPIAGGYALMGVLALLCVLTAERGRLFGVGAEYRDEKPASDRAH